MVGILVDQPSARLLKHIVRCYLRMSDNLRAREALRQCVPEALKENAFAATLKDDATTNRWLGQLIININCAPTNASSSGDPGAPSLLSTAPPASGSS